MHAQRFLDEHIAPVVSKLGAYAFLMGLPRGKPGSRLVYGIDLAHAPLHSSFLGIVSFEVISSSSALQPSLFEESGGHDRRAWWPGIFWRGTEKTQALRERGELWEDAVRITVEELRARYAAIVLGGTL